MGLWDKLKFWESTETVKTETVEYSPTNRHMQQGQSFAVGFDGEKNYGEMGPALHYVMDYDTLRIRSWQSMSDSEISQTILSKYTMWIMDKGLRLQSTPVSKVLEMNGLSINTEVFNDQVEAMFGVWARSKNSTFTKNCSFNALSKDVFKHSRIGGDALVVLRVVNKTLKVQLIDGANVQTPLLRVIPADGNRIVDGVEIDENGTHIAFHIRTKEFGKYERIEAIDKTTGLERAFMVYGNKHRVNETRGLPKIAASLETLKKLERYKEAAVGSAEERQKITIAIEHALGSEGENPWASAVAALVSTDGDAGVKGAIPTDDAGMVLQNNVAATTNKGAVNLPPGAKLTALESRNEMFFKDFYGTNADIICSSIGIPPNVAFSIYNDSFSASRAATKDWEHTMAVERDDYQDQYYNKIYQFWFHLEVLKNTIQAPGYLGAFMAGNFMIYESYTTARFTGTMFPHIDPVKEVEAERMKLGPRGKHIPLTTVEAACENLMTGDAKSNMEQFSRELNEAETVGIEPVKEKTDMTEQPSKKNPPKPN